MTASDRIPLRLPAGLHAGRLVVRPWEIADAPGLHDAIGASVEHLRPFMPWISNEPLSLRDRIAFVANWRTHYERASGDLPCGLFVDEEVVGAAGLHQRREPGVIEIGYWVHVDHVGQGIATTAAALLTEVAFSHPLVVAVEIWHDRANAASQAVPRRLGFAHIGTHAQTTEPRSPGEEGVDCQWRVTRERWATVRPSDPARLLTPALADLPD